jgi:hypothetical protein
MRKMEGEVKMDPTVIRIISGILAVVFALLIFLRHRSRHSE